MVLVLFRDLAEAERVHVPTSYTIIRYNPTRAAAMTPSAAVGELIREAREARGEGARKMSQTDLADKLGWKQRKISLIEAGKQPINVNEVEAVAQVLDLDALEMLKEAFRRYRAKSK